MDLPQGLGEIIGEDGAIDAQALSLAWQKLGDELGIGERGYVGSPDEYDPEVALRVWCREARIPPRYQKARAELVKPCQEYRCYVDGALHNWREGLGLVLCGPTGTGKSMAMANALKSCRQEDNSPSALWVTESDLVEAMKPGGNEGLVQSALTCQVLALDDFGVCRLTDFVLERLEQLAERRHARELSLLMTTNLTPKALESSAELARIWRRWSQDCLVGIMREKHVAHREAS